MITVSSSAIILKQFQRSYKSLYTNVPDCVSTYLMSNKNVNPRAIEIFHAICQYSKFNANGKLQISQIEIGSIIGGKSRWTALRAIKALCKEGVIEKQGNWICKDGQKQRAANTYIPVVPEEIASKASSKNKKLQTVAVVETKQTPIEKLLQALRDTVLISEEVAADECVLSIKKEMLNFIEAQEKLDAKREATDSKEVVNVPSQREQIENEAPAVVTEKTLPSISQTKSVPGAQTSIGKGVSLCSKNVTGINIKSNINTKITTEGTKVLKIREGPLNISQFCQKSVVDFKNLEKNSEAAEGARLNIEKFNQRIKKLEQEKAEANTKLTEMQKAGNKAEKYSWLRKYGGIIVGIEHLKNQLAIEVIKLQKTNAEALWHEKATTDMFWVNDRLKSQIQINPKELQRICKKLVSFGYLESEAILLCNEFSFSIKSGQMKFLDGCVNLKAGGRWTLPKGLNEFIAKNAGAILQMQIPIKK